MHHSTYTVKTFSKRPVGVCDVLTLSQSPSKALFFVYPTPTLHRPGVAEPVGCWMSEKRGEKGEGKKKGGRRPSAAADPPLGGG